MKLSEKQHHLRKLLCECVCVNAVVLMCAAQVKGLRNKAGNIIRTESRRFLDSDVVLTAQFKNKNES